ncbi:MAG TPA: hypothetical protein VH765_09010 [Xanthobacteraceae bacterium]|jgi:hypothetical protein
MAKTPRKSQDPTQAALSAIEEALQIGGENSESDSATNEGKLASADDTRRNVNVTPVTPATILDEPPVRRRTPGRRFERVAQSPANDDRQTVGQILAALNARPSRLPYIIAAVAGAWWVVMALLIGYSRAYQDIAQTTGLMDLVDLPYFWLFFATLVLPPILFFIFAAMVRRTQEMRLVSRAMTEVTLRLAEPEGVSTDAIVSVSQAIRREVAALGDGIERAIARASELETMVRNEVATLERAYDENELRVRALVDELQSERDAIVSHGTRLREAIGGAHENFSFDVEGVTNRIDSTLTEATDRINTALNEAGNRVSENFLAQAEAARAQVAAASDIVIETFTGRGTELSDRLAQIGIEVANSLDSRSARLTEAMNSSMEKITDVIVSKGNEVHDVLTARLTAAEDGIAQRGNEIAERIEVESTTLARRLTEGLQGFDNTVKVYGTGLVEQMNASIQVLNEQTRTALTGLDDRTSGKMRETTEAIDSRIQRIEQTIDSRTQALNETLANRTLELARTISDSSKVASEAVDKTVAGMGEYFATKAQEIAVTITDRAEAVDQTLGKRALEMTETLDTRIQRFEDKVANKLVSITETIETRGLALTDALATKVDEVTQNLRTGAAEVERSLIQIGDQMTKTLVDRMGEAVRGFAEQTTQIVAAHDALRENVMGSLDKLRESNTMFKQLLMNVTETLEPLESNVAKRVSGLQSALENTVSSTRTTVDWIDSQMHELRNIGSGVLRDLSALTQRFEGQGRYIASVADTLAETHGRIDQSLADRRDALEQIINMLADRTAAIEENFGTRSQQIGERLAAFNRLLQESLQAAEARAHEIARHVADSTNQITLTINKQHETIRNAYSEERGRTATALKSTYEESMEEMKQMFTELQERFTETAREVREVAQEVQGSLEQTRVELKRGVLELPHETRESAEAMRRVVSDQLKALAELNEIVGRHARDTELMEAGRAEATRYAGREQIAEMPRQRAAEPRGEPIEFRRPRQAETRRSREAPARERDEGERGGWLTDLLVRSARDEEQERGNGSPLHAIESLDSLSVDIARMIDHDAAVDLWDRHQRGERNVFTRRLYTAQGQKTFDEIRRRYRKSDDFRETVDRYIDEFERLLEQVSRDDRGQVLSKTYLTSDTGKVYTLLAHAAGRLN